MAEPTLYERLGGIFAIAAVVDRFSDRLLKNSKIVEANPELHEWHTEAYTSRLPGLKWLRTLWLAALAGGPFLYTGRELRDAHFDLKISPAVFDEVAAELSATHDQFEAPEREKGARSWPPSQDGRVNARLVPSLGPLIGAGGIEPSLSRA
jgi:hemoglobin